MPWLRRCLRRLVGIVAEWRHAFVGPRWPQPAAAHRTGTGTDLVRTRGQLLAENALLRQQLLVLHHSVTRPTLTPADRHSWCCSRGRSAPGGTRCSLSGRRRCWAWHSAGFRSCWRRKSRPGPGGPPLAAETIVRIRRMAAENPLWSARRIRGALGKVGIHVAKRTIQTYLRGRRAPRPRGQAWARSVR